MPNDCYPEIRSARHSALQFFRGEFRKAIESIPTEILQLSEIELYQTGKITQTDWFLRKNMWKLIENAQISGESTIRTVVVYEGITSHQNFFQQIVHSPVRVAWLLIPLTGSTELIDEAAYYGLQKLRNEILTMQVTEKSAPTILKAIEFLVSRAYGSIIQRIESKHAHLNLNKPIGVETLELDIEKRLGELRRKILASDSPAEPKP